jgi:aspartate/tyrosine/aromatic aminotransferase
MAGGQAPEPTLESRVCGALLNGQQASVAQTRGTLMSLLSAVEMAPRDPILGLNEQFAADPSPGKVNLGVGVYFDENGKLPLLQCVQQAEQQLLAAPKPHGYLPIDGIAAYDKAVQALVFGADSAAVGAGRIATVQAIGGTGGLKVGADFLHRLDPAAKVLISDPSWENHRALFTNAGFAVETYPITTPRRATSASTTCWSRCGRRRPARWSCCTPAATIRPATT